MTTSSMISARVSRQRLAKLVALLCAGVAACAFADTGTVNVPDVSKGSGSTPATLVFPITRSGDLGFDVLLDYQTSDGSALAGTDYTAASGSLTLAAGSAGTTIPVTISANTSSTPSVDFQLRLANSVGIGPGSNFRALQLLLSNAGRVAVADFNGDGKPDLAATLPAAATSEVAVMLNDTAPGASTLVFSMPQILAAPFEPLDIVAADLNGDGKPDLIVPGFFDDNVYVYVNTTTPGASTPTFAAPQMFSAGSFPEGPAVADINGDGKLDIVVANLHGGAGSGDITVLLNTTAPGSATVSFAAAQTIFVDGASELAIADLNGDGRPDVVVATGNTVTVLLNVTTAGSAQASFAAQQTFPVAVVGICIATADINGDGKPDVITGDFGNDDISVLINTTAPGSSVPSFAAQQPFVHGSTSVYNPYSIAVGDINGDGKTDVLVPNYNDGTVSVLRNTTAPSGIARLALQEQFATGLQPWSVAVADLNSDGRPDLIVSDSNGVSAMLNAVAPYATAGLADQQSFAAGANPYSAVAADFNGDGLPDVAAANFSDATVSVSFNTTTAGSNTTSFASQQTFATGSGPVSVAAADLNGDGLKDLVVANQHDDNVSVLFGTTTPGAATPGFAAQHVFAAGPTPQSVTLADLNGDGLQDLIVSNYKLSGTVSVLLNTTAAGAATPSFAAAQSFGAGGLPAYALAADINGDGMPDLIVANQNDNTVSVLLNTTAPGAASAAFAAQQTFAVGNGPNYLAVADINGDGLPDVITANQSSDNTVSVLFNTTARGAATPSFATAVNVTSGSLPSAVFAADVDGDGKPDLLVTNYLDNNVALLVNTTAAGAAVPSFASVQTHAVGAAPASVVAADLNGDGKPDLLVANSQGNSVSILLNSQFRVELDGTPATGTIVHDYIFANGFD